MADRAARTGAGLSRFRSLVYETGGRIVRVHPRLQIVAAIVDCVTSGLSTPGVNVQLATTAARGVCAPQRGSATTTTSAAATANSASSTTVKCMPSTLRAARASASVLVANVAQSSRFCVQRRVRSVHLVARERPDDDSDPRDADHVGLQAEEEHRGEGGREPRGAGQPPEQRQRPRDEDQARRRARSRPPARCRSTRPLRSSRASEQPSPRRCRGRIPTGGATRCAHRRGSSTGAHWSTPRSRSSRRCS